MLEYYQYIYFRIYCWNYYLWENKNMASFNSTLGISLSELCLILLVRIIIEDYFKISVPRIFDSFFSILLIVFLFIGLNIKLFEKKLNYLDLEEKYKTQKENKIEWFKNGIIPFLLALGPIIALIILI